MDIKKLSLILLVLLLSLALCNSTLYAQEEDGTETELSGDLGKWLQEIKAERTAAAKDNRPVNDQLVFELFKKIIEKDPSNKEALTLVYELGPAILLQNLAQEGGSSAIIQELLRRGERFFVEQVNDPDKIARWVEDIAEEDLDTRWAAINLLVNKYGAYAVPFVIENLSKTATDNERVGANLFLNKLGWHATLPLMEGLKSDDESIRTWTASILGNIGDTRAVPALLGLIQSNDNKNAIDVDSAIEALKKITGDAWSNLGTAEEAYARYAYQSYMNDPEILLTPKYRTVWNWDNDADAGGKLHSTAVPRFTYNERLAEKLCYEALSLNPDYGPAWNILICSFYTQEIEANSVFQLSKDEFQGQDLDKLTELVNQLYKINGLSMLTGKQLLYPALEQALIDQRPKVAVAILRSLYDVENGDDFPAVIEDEGYASPLGLALVYDDKRVRYAAADLMLHINTQENFTYKNTIIPTAIQALSETATRIILVVSSDKMFRELMTETLEDLGHFPVTERSRYRGLTHARSYPALDLIIIDNRLSSNKGNNTTDGIMLAADLAKDYRTKDIPFLVYDPIDSNNVEAVQAVKENYDNRLEDIFFTPDPDEYKLTIEHIFKNRRLNETRELSYREAERIANTVAQLTPRFSTYDLKALLPALNGNIILTDRPEYLIIASANCLAQLQAASSEKPLADQFNNTDLQLETRLALANALTPVMAHNKTISEDTMKILLNTLHEGEKSIELATARILGSAPLSRKQRFDVYNSERPQLKNDSE